MVCCSCSSNIHRDPISLADLDDPQVPNMQDVRFWGDTPPANISALNRDVDARRRAAGLGGAFNVLALSGGAENGAFSAGALKAWSESGSRPEFLVVTGVSTGALAAPFAYLGSDYDDDLRQFFGGLEPDSIFKVRSLFGVLPNASRYSSEPLRETIEAYITPEFLAAIAKQHERGRRLLVQTTSLDAQRAVIWDLGAIAASGAPNAPDLFRDVLLASSAMPAIFPPVLIEVETPDGVRDELHVDGGVISQSTSLNSWRHSSQLAGRPTLYLIRNGKIAPEPNVTDANLLSIAERSLTTLTKNQGASELELGYKLARATNARYRVAWIGEDFTLPLAEPFDPEYMRALYSYGYDSFKSGDFWRSGPPR
ncbi:patatin-like phospholipase [Shimia isoporae]|uniref:Patatin-like phospholipase n=2 Tax=Shimia isoporae TaxID=647720 RepID=A0A4R1NNZ3_9RHOB|nr:patatin-like phospholipase [Shimia isoporae]